MEYWQRVEAFENEFGVDFLRDVVHGLEVLYPETFDETAELPSVYQRYLRPHLLRTKAEMAFLTAAQRHELVAAAIENTSGDVHALIVGEPFVLTLSKIAHPRLSPRPARFRTLYSCYASFGQFPLEGDEFTLDHETVAINDEAQPIYVLIGHGPDASYRELGFVYANFVAPGGVGYLGPGMDLLERYATGTVGSIEEIGEPRVDLHDDGDEEDAQSG